MRLLDPLAGPLYSVQASRLCRIWPGRMCLNPNSKPKVQYPKGPDPKALSPFTILYPEPQALNPNPRSQT